MLTTDIIGMVLLTTSATMITISIVLYYVASRIMKRMMNDADTGGIRGRPALNVWNDLITAHRKVEMMAHGCAIVGAAFFEALLLLSLLTDIMK